MHILGKWPHTLNRYNVQFLHSYKSRNKYQHYKKQENNKSPRRTDKAYMTNITLQQKNSSPATNLELGWVIDSGASAYMTPFRSDYCNINHTYKQIYLADDSSILRNQMGVIEIPIKSQRKEIGKLILEDI